MAVYLYKITTKLDDGPWTMPANFTPDEQFSVLGPYLKLMFSVCKGVIAPPNVLFMGSDTFVRKYTVDTVENARALKAFLEDISRPETKAMRDLSAKYHAGTTYSSTWKLTQDYADYQLAIAAHGVGPGGRGPAPNPV